MKPAPAPTLVLCFLLAACGEEPPVEDPFVPAKHLLLISIDALRADHVGCYGGRDRVSPTIDGLAATGVIFEHAYAPVGMTLPSVASLFTSRYPDETGVLDNKMVLDTGELTLAERLSAAGFRCQGLVANGVLRPQKSGVDQGFEFFRRIENEQHLTGKAKQILGDRFGQEQREFLWLHYMDPHQPYDPRPPYAVQFDPFYSGNINTSPETLDAIFVKKVAVPERDIEYIKSVYDSQIRRIDDFIAKVLNELEYAGVADETLVVLTADHGDDIYDHNCYFYHANSLYRSVTNVPLIFRYPREFPAGGRVDGIVELIDVMPTILATLGLDPEAGDAATHPRGMDLRAAMSGAPVQKSYAFAQVRNRIYAVRNQDWLYVTNPTGYMPKSVPEEGTYPIAERELYRLASDAREQENVVAEHPDIERKMRAALEHWQSRLRRGTARAQVLSDEERREMAEMGYLGGDDE